MADQVQRILVRLLDEGVDCWRPVDAILVGPGIFRITSPPPSPEDERWEFDSGQHVVCEEREFDGGRHLVAVLAASSD